MQKKLMGVRKIIFRTCYNFVIYCRKGLSLSFFESRDSDFWYLDKFWNVFMWTNINDKVISQMFWEIFFDLHLAVWRTWHKPCRTPVSILTFLLGLGVVKWRSGPAPGMILFFYKYNMNSDIDTHKRVLHVCCRLPVVKSYLSYKESWS
jgi:hypothetical protein